MGALRTGSARRLGGTVAGRVLGVARTAKAAAAAKRAKQQEKGPGGAGGDPPEEKEEDATAAAAAAGTAAAGNVRPPQGRIQATIVDMLHEQDQLRHRDGGEPPSRPASDYIKTTSTASSMGLFGEPVQGPEPAPPSIAEPQPPYPGSILLDPAKSVLTAATGLVPTLKPWEDLRSVKSRISIRVATPSDDSDVANLRMSVFSEFTPELRKKFCAKSCELLACRRNRGACILVASIDQSMRDGIVRRNVIEEGKEYGLSREVRRPDPGSWFMGSVECSVHEFHETELGRRRPSGSTLYITEVAVLPEARRCGAAARLMAGVDELAKARGVEMLYLHVDVNNRAAIKLYQKAGYAIVDRSGDQMYENFTRSLNLQDGATRGRIHLLMEKQMVEHPTWIDSLEIDQSISKEAEPMGALGFEV